MPLTVRKPLEHFFIGISFFLLVFLFFNGIFQMTPTVSGNLGNGIAMFLGWAAFLSVWFASFIPALRWIDSDTELCGCKCSTTPSPVDTSPPV